MEKDLRSYDTKDNKGYITKAVEILGNELNNDNQAIAIAMDHIIKNNPNVFKGFKDVFNNTYAQHLKK